MCFTHTYIKTYWPIISIPSTSSWCYEVYSEAQPWTLKSWVTVQSDVKRWWMQNMFRVHRMSVSVPTLHWVLCELMRCKISLHATCLSARSDRVLVSFLFFPSYSPQGSGLPTVVQLHNRMKGKKNRINPHGSRNNRLLLNSTLIHGSAHACPNSSLRKRKCWCRGLDWITAFSPDLWPGPWFLPFLLQPASDLDSWCE